MRQGNGGLVCLEGWSEQTLLLVSAFFLWLLNHPYRGVWHDARVYALEAAHWIYPEEFANDLFFRFGSQGQLSLFTPLYGEMVRALGLSSAAWWLTLIGGVAWVCALAALARGALGAEFLFRFAVLCGASASISYSPTGGVFLLGESFATARMLAIPLALFCIAALMAKRDGLALLAAVLSTLLHPLLGIWPLCAWVLMRFSTPKFAALTSAFPLLFTAIIDWFSPSVPGLRAMTGAWLEVAVTPLHDIAFSSLSTRRFPFIASVMMALWIGARAGTVTHRRVYARTLMLGLGGLALALYVSYCYPMELMIQAQPWRVMALLIPVGFVALLDAAGRMIDATRHGFVWLASMGVVAIGWPQHAVLLLAVVSVGVIAPKAYLRRVENTLSPWIKWIVVMLCLAALSLAPGVWSDIERDGMGFVAPWWQGKVVLHGLVAGGGWVFPLMLAGALTALSSARSPLRGTVTVLACITVLVSVTMFMPVWDNRSDNADKRPCLLDKRCPDHPFEKAIGRQDTVYWPGHEMTLWFVLHRSSYYGPIAQTGSIFSREKFDEALRRQRHLEQGNSVRTSCADPALDWIVLPTPVAEVQFTIFADGAYLYSCEVVRESGR